MIRDPECIIPRSPEDFRLARLLGEIPYPERTEVEVEPNYRGLAEYIYLSLFVGCLVFTVASWVGLL